MIPLPIDEHLPAIVAALRESQCLVVRAPAGAGKTTRVPPALLDAGVCGNGQVWVLQPRRVAARTTSARMADERGSRLGDEIGYQIRFERRTSSRTRLIVMTEGVLTRRLLDDPFLEGVGTVVLDEFHERHLETDLALAMVRRVQQTVRPDLKLVVMSATLATEALVKYLAPSLRPGLSEGPASPSEISNVSEDFGSLSRREAGPSESPGLARPVIACAVRTHPIAIEYLSAIDDRPLPAQAAAAVRRVFGDSAGDLLVFLPGVREIQRTAGLLEGINASVLPLYGDLPAEQQDRVFQPSQQRKVILATNVAETSITIPGVTMVVDSGWARVAELDSALGLNRLALKPISQASADQRAGRAGRTGPGRCLRLWTEASHRVRPAYETPEIHRVDLAGVVLQLRCWGEADIRSFPWFDPPKAESINRAEALLRALDAVGDAGVTALGRQIVQLPVHPRLARLVLEGAQHGHRWEAALAAAVLSERDPFVRGEGPSRPATSSSSDVLDRVEALREFIRTGRTEFTIGRLHPGGAQRIRQAAEQLEHFASQKPTGRAPWVPLEHALGRAILAAFPDRLARRREPQSRKALLVCGRGVRLADQSAVTEPELFIAVDVDAAGDDALVRMASGVERDWLPEEHLQTNIEVEFDDDAVRIQARRRTRWFDLVLDETPSELPDDETVAAALAQAARLYWSRVFPPEDRDAASLVTRVRCLSDWMPELNLPVWDDTELQELLPQVCLGCRSLDELKRAPWLDVLRASLTGPQRAAVDREAPERLVVPSGSRIALAYEVGRPPVLAVRIQEVFGWSDTPRIAGGRVPVLLHLLAPNHRPQQITDDLRSFWSTAYQQIRGELRRRYPKHAWPEDPWTAVAERRPRR